MQFLNLLTRYFFFRYIALLEILFILILEIIDSGTKQMKKRMSQKEFSRFYTVIWRRGPQVRYQNPDSWFNNNLSNGPL